MASNPFQDINALDDISKLCQAMQSLGISTFGLTTLDDLRARATREIERSRTNTDWTAGKAFSVLSRAKEEDERKKGELLHYYELMLKCLENMADEKLLNFLNIRYSTDIKEAVKKQRDFLKRDEFVILVAGETSAGKSTVINSILGIKLLPTHSLTTTATICELRYAEKPKLVLHFETKSNKSEKEIELSETGSYLEQITKYIKVDKDNNKTSPYQKVVLYWPHEVLEKGVVIVDSPGIRDSKSIEDMVINYLTEAFCFLYVVDSGSAGGIAEDRIEKLFLGAKEKCKERGKKLLHESVLFVCNKWDRITEEMEEEEVNAYIISNLMKSWPEMTAESQIIHLSARNALTAQSYGMVSAEFRLFIDGVRSMVLRSIDVRLQEYTSWLEILVSRCTHFTETFINNVSKTYEEYMEKMLLVTKTVVMLENRSEALFKTLHKERDEKVDGLVEKLFQHVRSKEFKNSFTSWTADDTPKVQETWVATYSKINQSVMARFITIIQNWEDKNKCIKEEINSLMVQARESSTAFHRRLDDIEKLIENSTDLPIEDPSSSSLKLTTTDKVVLGFTSPIWLPVALVSAVFLLPALGVMKLYAKIDDKMKLAKYVENKRGFMSNISNDYLKSLYSNKELLQQVVTYFFKEVDEFLNESEKCIPAIIKANRILVGEYLREAFEKGAEWYHYQPINEKFSKIDGNLAMFWYRELRQQDIKANDLVCNESSESLLGVGGFASVHKGEMKQLENSVPVALKIIHEKLSWQNAKQFRNEENNLRKLSDPSVVTFYGTALRIMENEATLIFVMELCSGNLRDYLEKHPESTPGRHLADSKHQNDPKKMVQLALQITAGLCYIHGVNIVHRDVKAENILVVEENTSPLLKIADVGLSKKQDEITGRIAGTLIYVAPEVFSSKVYDCKADIYSLGLTMWEMWHGVRAYSQEETLTNETLGDFIKDVCRGLRPNPPSSCFPPPDDFKQLIERCWDTEPKKRPTANDIDDNLRVIFKGKI